jgi:hypothetical protein
MRPKVRIISMDMDGCTLRNVTQLKQLERYNLLLLQLLSQKRRKFTDGDWPTYRKNIVTLGTARQDFHIDRLNSRQGQRESTPYAASALVALAQALSNKGVPDVHIDPFTMADLYGLGRQGGENFTTMLTNSASKPRDAWAFDSSKITLVYAQVHRAAALNPDDDIDYLFFDDNKKILEGIANWFSNNPTLMPNNVTLTTYWYPGKGFSYTPHPCKKVVLEGSPSSLIVAAQSDHSIRTTDNIKYFKAQEKNIKGTGCTDINYQWTIRKTAEKYRYNYNTNRPDRIDGKRQNAEIVDSDLLNYYSTANEANTNWNDCHEVAVTANPYMTVPYPNFKLTPVTQSAELMPSLIHNEDQYKTVEDMLEIIKEHGCADELLTLLMPQPTSFFSTLFCCCRPASDQGEETRSLLASGSQIQYGGAAHN